MTDSSTKSSPPSTLPFVSPRETPPYSPDVRSHHSGSPSAAASPLPPLPTEVFLNVLRFLPQADIERFQLVSRVWNTYLVNEPSLWGTLSVELALDQRRLVERVCRRASVNRSGNGQRANGGIRHLAITLSGQPHRDHPPTDYVPQEQAVQRFVEIVDMVSDASILINSLGRPPGRRHSTLARLTLRLHPNSSTPAVILWELSKISRSAVFTDLEHLDVFVSLPRLDLTRSVLQMFPSLATLSIAAAPPNNLMRKVNVGNWFWEPPAGHRRPSFALDRLERLSLRGVSIGEDLELPQTLPRLRELELADTMWEGRALFLLLRLARKTLETIYATDFAFEAPEDELEDWLRTVDIREPELTDDHIFPDSEASEEFPDPAPIVLPVLRELHLGSQTPPFFANLNTFEITPESEMLPTPVLVMPRLRVVDLDDITVDPEMSFDDSYGPLATLGRSAPDVQVLKLCNLNGVSDEALTCCLAAMSARVTSLDIADSQVTDHTIVRLPDLVPSLQELDVRNCVDVSCQGVARAVEVIRMRHDEGDSKVRDVWVSPPGERDDPACWQAYRWLDFVGVLRRDELDYEGDGPLDPKFRRSWAIEGKKDAMWQDKEKYAVWWQQEDRKRWAKAAEEEAKRLQAGGSGSRSARPAPAAMAIMAGSHYSPLPLQQLAQMQQQHLAQQQHPQQQRATFLPPGLAMPQIPQMSIAPIPSAPAATAVGLGLAATRPNSTPLPTHRPTPQAAVSAPFAQVSQQQQQQLPGGSVPPSQHQSRGPTATSRLPPSIHSRPPPLHAHLAHAQEQSHQHPAAPLSQPRKRAPSPPPSPSREEVDELAGDREMSEVDYSQLDLDSFTSLDQLPPAVLAEQQKAMEQAQKWNEARMQAEIAAAVERAPAAAGVQGEALLRDGLRHGHAPAPEESAAQKDAVGAPEDTQDTPMEATRTSAPVKGTAVTPPATVAGAPGAVFPFGRFGLQAVAKAALALQAEAQGAANENDVGGWAGSGTDEGEEEEGAFEPPE
ncbi:hypothetical protein JCM10213_006968 [Rhodosporidiobolus nylandii]